MYDDEQERVGAEMYSGRGAGRATRQRAVGMGRGC